MRAHAAVEPFIENLVASEPVVLFSKTTCPFCAMAKEALADAGVAAEVVELDRREDGKAFQDALEKMTGARSVPRVFVQHTFRPLSYFFVKIPSWGNKNVRNL